MSEIRLLTKEEKEQIMSLIIGKKKRLMNKADEKAPKVVKDLNKKQLSELCALQIRVKFMTVKA